MQHENLSEDDLRVIRDTLPRGANKKLAEKFKVSKQYITNVLKAIPVTRVDIIEAAAKMAKEHSEEIQEKTKHTKEIIDSIES